MTKRQRSRATPTPVQEDNVATGQGAMPLYELSSQFRHWRYSKDELDKIRQQLNEQAVDRIRLNIERERAQSSVTQTSSEHDNIEYLTVQDELLLVQYYLTQISGLCGAFKFPESVQATAISYLKRFYLSNTCMDYHPKNVMLTCVFLATKTENCPCSIDSFASKVKTSTSDILELEFLVSQSLRFQYKVHHAHLCASGLLLDMQTTGASLEQLQQVYAQSKSFIRTSRLTDLEFVYSPSQISLACFNLTNSKLVESWLGFKHTRQTQKKRKHEELHSTTKANKVSSNKSNDEDDQTDLNELDKQRLIDVLVHIGEIILQTKENPIDKTRVTEIDKRLRVARNPEKDPNSLLFKNKQAQDQAQRDAKAKQRAAAQSINNDGSVFD
ncbi:hypothetical protein OIO90_003492 [Microbotryomycetes sp. JL221]|nr:hypothetical protein OIO90_003492 [Microbotryomycetes sp. JL221]